jgi:hypothetical protein
MVSSVTSVVDAASVTDIVLSSMLRLWRIVGLTALEWCASSLPDTMWILAIL